MRRGSSQSVAVTFIVTVLALAVLAGAAIPLLSGGQSGPVRDPGWVPQSTRTATLTRSMLSTPRPLPTATARLSQAPAMTPKPTHLAVTPTPTVLPAPSGAGVLATASVETLTPTPIPTTAPTLAPNATPTMIRSEPTQTPLPTPTQPLPVTQPILVDPADGATGRGIITFRWQPTSPLPPGADYEVVWWTPDQPPQAARGFAPPTQGNSLELNIDVLFTSNQVPGGRFFWTVLVVSQDPYVRLTQPQASPQHSFIYQQ